MKCAIVGATGAVGLELKSLLQGKNPLCFDSKSEISFQDVDVAFFCVSKEIASFLIPKAREQGVVCIDSSTLYREDPSVPLIIPEINAHALKGHKGIIASPNCTTSLMLLPLALLHRKWGIKRIFAATYQAVSGAGLAAMGELKEHSKNFLKESASTSTIFPHSPAFNVFPHESPMHEDGYVAEEKKMHSETQKILEDKSIAVSAMCTRVPVFRVHSMALSVEFSYSLDKAEAVTLLEQTPGVIFQNSFSALDAAMKNSVYCGRVRIDPTRENTLEMWIAGDQLLKGAALNMVQIANELGFS